jgi:uncharacterized protein
MRRICAVPGFLIDTSVWLAAVFPIHREHLASRQALIRASAAQPAVFCRAAEQSFLRLLTTASVFKAYGLPAMTNIRAVNMLTQILMLPHVVQHAEPEDVAVHWHKFAALPSPSPKVWMDAYLAAFAIAGGLTLVTLDSDFHSFVQHGLRVHVLATPAD